jgi:hypothetical protein
VKRPFMTKPEIIACLIMLALIVAMTATGMTRP